MSKALKDVKAENMRLRNEVEFHRTLADGYKRLLLELAVNESEHRRILARAMETAARERR